MVFLSEAIDQKGFSLFAESIMLATICGRALSHRQQSAVEHVYSNVAQHFWDRHDWLDKMLKTRADILLMNYPSAAQNPDCMLIFTNMVAQTTVLYLCKVMESMSFKDEVYRNAIVEFKQRSLLAAQEIVNLSRSLARLSYFKVSPFPLLPLSPVRWLLICQTKVHPFTPLSLAMCADFFTTHRYLDESVDSQVQEVLDVLKDMTTVNNLAQDYLLS
jgi:hypothetical protein